MQTRDEKKNTTREPNVFNYYNTRYTQNQPKIKKKKKQKSNRVPAQNSITNDVQMNYYFYYQRKYP